MVVLALTFLLTGGRYQSSDGEETYKDAQRLIQGLRPVSRFPPGQVIMLSPVALIEQSVAGKNLLPAQGFLMTRIFTLVSCFSAFGVAWMLVLLLGRLGFSPREAAWFALLCSTATILLPYGASSCSEIIHVLALLCSFYYFLIFLDEKTVASAFCCGLFLGCSILLKPTFGPIAGLLMGGAYLAVGRRFFPRWFACATLFVLPVFAGSVLYLLYNFWRSGSPWIFGYEEGFTGRILTGLFGQLLSPGKSLFLYSPVLLFVFWGWKDFVRTHRVFAWVCLLSFLAYLLLYSKWWSWAGDWSWGPRYIVPLTPMVFLPAAFAIRRFWSRGRVARAAVCAVCILSFGLQIVACSVSYLSELSMTERFRRQLFDEYLKKSSNPNLQLEFFVPEFSPLLGMPWLLARSIEFAPIVRDRKWGQFCVKWEGEILVPPADGPDARLRFRSEGGTGQAKIDGKAAPSKSGRSSEWLVSSLSQGWHPIKLKYAVANSAKSQARSAVALEWKSNSSSEYVPVPAKFLRVDGREGGLKARYYASNRWRNKREERLDAGVNFNWKSVSPFDEWVTSGFPGAKLFQGDDFPSRLSDWMFRLNPWPMNLYYSRDSETHSVAGSLLALTLLGLALSVWRFGAVSSGSQRETEQRSK